eukprot:TRINITY_DN25393_c0_g1_i2.p4 TRINITY_DN25393_c0_g1~~TRINITY_DN25393_c0_g1_i2.p4  ORF type:complete len:108 (-),score=21.33 TRINITY_DN25393_c0_g1_i2:67-390(-)
MTPTGGTWAAPQPKVPLEWVRSSQSRMYPQLLDPLILGATTKEALMGTVAVVFHKDGGGDFGVDAGVIAATAPAVVATADGTNAVPAEVAVCTTVAEKGRYAAMGGT